MRRSTLASFVKRGVFLLAIIIIVGFINFEFDRKITIKTEVDGRYPGGRSLKQKTILLWRPFYKDWTYGMLGSESSAFDDCPVKCRLSKDQNDLQKADAVIFSMSDDHWGPTDEVFKQRKPHQKFIFFILEMAVRAKYFRDLFPFNGFFNWTMSYRRDSDVYFPYGWKEDITVPEEDKKALATKDYSQNKTHLVCWFVSHCHTGSKREFFVKHLAQHVNVSIFGKCGVETPKDFVPRCKFYLAFENMICKDYVTEKLFGNAYMMDRVPVVYGGGNYQDMLPKHSYINVGDFNSPKDLANYLKLLDRNDALYNQYFEWKTQYRMRLWYTRDGVKGTSVYAFCNLCKKLNDDKQDQKVYNRIDEWWDYKNRCPQFRPWPKLHRYFNKDLLPK